MKGTLVIWVCLFISSISLQAQTSDNSVAGTSQTDSEGNQTAWTVGQLSSTTLNSNSGTLQQGIHDSFFEDLGGEVLHAALYFELKLYPNPATKTIILESTTHQLLTGSTYQLINMQGQIIRTGLIEEHAELEVLSLKKGTYFLKIYSEQLAYTHKFIKH